MRLKAANANFDCNVSNLTLKKTGHGAQSGIEIGLSCDQLCRSSYDFRSAISSARGELRVPAPYTVPGSDRHMLARFKKCQSHARNQRVHRWHVRLWLESGQIRKRPHPLVWTCLSWLYRKSVAPGSLKLPTGGQRHRDNAPFDRIIILQEETNLI